MRVSLTASCRDAGQAAACRYRRRVEPDQQRPVRLVAVSPENVRAVCDLRVQGAQERFVSPAAVSLAEAYVHPVAWCRAILAENELVGFVMLHDTDEPPGYMLWRLLIDQRFQRYGFGRAAVQAVADYVRTRPGATTLKTSARRGQGSPHGFYERLGFERTGEVLDGDEDVLILDLTA